MALDEADVWKRRAEQAIAEREAKAKSNAVQRVAPTQGCGTAQPG
jgi:hypothetical protein